MAEITLGKHSSTEVLSVKIEDKTYSVPLAGSIPYGQLRKLQKGKNDPDLIAEFFGKYIPEEVLDNLHIEDINQLMLAWSDATQKATGASVGE